MHIFYFKLFHTLTYYKYITKFKILICYNIFGDFMDLKNMIKECNKIVFFGGAGVSTESGIKDFRSVDGLYNIKYDY